MRFDVSDEICYRLKELAGKHHITEAEVIRRALALYSVCDERTPKDGHVVIADKNYQPIIRLVGL